MLIVSRSRMAAKSVVATSRPASTAPASPPARGRSYRRGASRAPGALRARVGRAFPGSMQARAAESIRLRGSRPRAEGPRRPANNSLDVAEILEALANLLLLFLGVGG